MITIEKKTVIDFYIREIDADKINFLTKDKSVSQEIKDTLILLKNAKEIEKEIEIVKKIWKLLFENALSSIDSDRKGYDDLFRYLDEFIDFENLLFASDEFYRDHTLHSLWVYLLGEYVQNTEPFKNLFGKFIVPTGKLDNLYKLQKFLSKIEENRKDVKLFYHQKFFIDTIIQYFSSNQAVWCIIALCHDLGYPIKSIKNINKKIKCILPYFSIKEPESFYFAYDRAYESFISSFLNLLCEYGRFNPLKSNPLEADKAFKLLDKYIWGSDCIYKDLTKSEIVKLTDEEINDLKNGLSTSFEYIFSTGSKMRFSYDLNKLHHGIFSSLILVNNLRTFRKTLEKESEPIKFRSKQPKSATSPFLKHMILNSIAHHTSRGYLIKNITDFSDLLIIVDEMEEFSRISRAGRSRDFVKEFCRTEIDYDEDVLKLGYIFEKNDETDINPLFFFKEKCKRFLSIINFDELSTDFKIKMLVADKRSHEYKTYTLCIKMNNAEIYEDDEIKDINNYLDSKEFNCLS